MITDLNQLTPGLNLTKRLTRHNAASLLDIIGVKEARQIYRSQHSNKQVSHQDSMVLAQRQIYRSMDQNRKPRDKSTSI